MTTAVDRGLGHVNGMPIPELPLIVQWGRTQECAERGLPWGGVLCGETR
jgi:hypothetical protein